MDVFAPNDVTERCLHVDNDDYDDRIEEAHNYDDDEPSMIVINGGNDDDD